MSLQDTIESIINEGGDKWGGGVQNLGKFLGQIFI